MFVAIRKTLGITAVPTALVSDVVQVESYLGGTIPDDLLAYWLAMGARVGALTELTRSIHAYYDAMGEKAWKKKLGFAHVALDDTYGAEEGILCACLGEGPATIRHWMLRKGEAWTPTFVPQPPSTEPDLFWFCRWKYGEGAKQPVDFDEKLREGELDAFAPALILEASPEKRRVNHPTFGEGLVLRTIAPDKLEIDFGSRGVKKLLASSVQDA
jgi:hypothetical protein